MSSRRITSAGALGIPGSLAKPEPAARPDAPDAPDRDVLTDAVSAVLNSEAAVHEDELAGTPAAAPALLADLETHFAHLAGVLGLPVKQAELDALGERDGMFALDAKLAGYLEQRHGAEGERAAAVVRRRARDRRASDEARPAWMPWASPGHAARLLARVLWIAEVRPRLDRARRTPAALSMPFLDHVTAPMRPGVRLDDGQLIDAEGVLLDTVTRELAVGVPLVELGTLDALTARGVGQLRSLNAHRLVWWLAEEARRAYLSRSKGLPNTIHVEGGWTELARRVLAGASGDAAHEPSRSDADDLKVLLITIARRMDFAHPDGTTGHLLALRWRRPCRGRSGLVVITLTDPWLPYYVKTLPKRTTAQRAARLLAPVLPPPPLHGSPRFHGGQAAFARDLVSEMARRSDVVASQGGLPETWARREERGDRFGLTPKTLHGTWDRWLEMGFVAEPAPGIVALGQLHAGAWAFILQGGRRRLDAAGRSRRRRR